MTQDLPTRPVPNVAASQRLAAMVQRYRTAAGLTQEELAERAGLSVRAISDLERGVRGRPQRATIQLLADGLGLTGDERAVLEAAARGQPRHAGQAARSLDLPVGSFLGAVPEGPLVGREREIERIRQMVAAVAAGAGRLLLFLGEPGVGKTRLAQEVTLICRAGGMHLAAGRCADAQQSAAFWPFLQIFSQLVSAAHASLDGDPLQRWPHLAPLLPERSAHAGPHLPRDGDPRRLFWAASGFIEALSTVRPLVIAIDDLHWADQSSLDLLRHLTYQLRNAPVLLVAAYRDVDVSRRHPLAPVIRDVHRERLAEEIAVGRLNQEETGRLISSILGRQDISPGIADLVYRHTQGNAFFVQEVVRTLVEREDIFRRNGVWQCRPDGEIALPRSVREAVGERLSRLSDEAQAILSEASVLGQTFEFEELLAMSGRPEDAMDAAVDEAVQASVVLLREGETYSFNHALTQSVLYRELAPRRRRRLHLAAANAIEHQSARVLEQRAAELTRHLLEGGDTQRALPYAVLAGDRADRHFAHREAELHYRTALRLARDREDTPMEAAIAEKLGRVLTNVGRFAEAETVLEQAVEHCARAADRAGEIRVTVQLGSVYISRGVPQRGIERVEALRASVAPESQPADLVELYIVLETLYLAIGRHRDALAAAEAAVELARQLGDDAALARAETGRGAELVALGHFDEGIHVLEEAIALGERTDDPYNLARAFDYAAIGYLCRGMLRQSLAVWKRSLALQEQIQVPWGIAVALNGVAVTYRALGEWEQARSHLERAEALCRLPSPSAWAVWPFIELGSLYLDIGEQERGVRLVEEAVELARHGSEPGGERAGECVLAQLDILEGRPDRARGRLEPLLERIGHEDFLALDILPVLAAAHEGCGDLRRAEDMVQEAIRGARRARFMRVLGEGLIVQGRIMTAHADWTAAERDLGEAVGLAQDMSCPFLEARGLFELGVMRGKCGECDAARACMEAALSIFRRLGAQPYIERTERWLTHSCSKR